MRGKKVRTELTVISLCDSGYDSWLLMSRIEKNNYGIGSVFYVA
jgi:hypothetical protein